MSIYTGRCIGHDSEAFVHDECATCGHMWMLHNKAGTSCHLCEAMGRSVDVGVDVGTTGTGEYVVCMTASRLDGKSHVEWCTINLDTGRATVVDGRTVVSFHLTSEPK